MQKRSLTVLLSFVLAAVLAACGGTGDGPPGGDPPPGGGDTGEITGFVRTPTLDRSVNGTVISICTGGSGCSTPGSVLADLTVRHDGPQAPFGFTDLSEAGSYDVVAYKELSLESDEHPGGQQPEIWYYAIARNVPAGGDEVTLQLQLEASEPTNGTAVVTGTVELPGHLGSASLTAGEESGVLGAAAISGFIGTRPGVNAPEPLGANGEALSSPSSLSTPEVIPGEIVVTFEEEILFSQAALSTLSASGLTLQHLSGGADGELHLYAAEGLDEAATIALARELRTHPHIKTAMPNWRLHAFRAPNDEQFPLQWHYSALNLEAAWDIETGTTNPVTVAVVDTGSISHPDLAFTGGYDFVSTGGRDSDPTDDGDSYHGAHVAGTVAARTNNGLGVAGVSWGATLVPVRALGVDGSGSSFDILDSVLWAAGESVAGVPSNPHPADVINLSLGADLGVTCAEALGGSDTFFSDLISRTGVIIVAAAGNSGINARHTFPASCPGVITVGATGPDGQQTAYSNFGRDVDVMAPGGNLDRSFTGPDGTRHAAGILSTVLDRHSGMPTYEFQQGTSMAAPHITGLIALMLSADPGMTSTGVLAALRSAASPVPGCGPGDCGAGLVDAAAALGGGAPVEPPPPPAVAVAPLFIQFDYCLNDACNEIDYGRTKYVKFDQLDAPVVEYVIWDLEPGRYFVWALLDLNDNGLIEPDDYVSNHGHITVEPNSVTSGVDIRLEAYVD